MKRTKKQEREEREAAWRAEEERIRALERLFEALPAGEAKDALLAGMRDRVIDLYNDCKYEQGDAILEFWPREYALKFLDWYFHDEDTPHPPEAPASEHEATQQGQVQGGAQVEERPDGLGPIPPDA